MSLDSLGPRSVAPARLSTHASFGMPSMPACKIEPRRVRDVVGEGRLRLELWADEADAEALERWLTLPAPDAQHARWDRLLARAWRGMGSGFEAIAPAQALPQRVTIRWTLIPEGCAHAVLVDHGLAHAATKLTIPIVTPLAALADATSARAEVQEIVRVAAHETAHALQLYPFADGQLRWFRTGGLYALRHGGMRISQRTEAQAMWIERAIVQAVMPAASSDTIMASAWRDARTLFPRIVGEPAYTRVFDSHFQAMQRRLGPAFVDPRGDRELRLMLADAARYLDRPARKGEQSVLGLTSAARRGALALDAIRLHTPAIEFTDVRYGAVGVPAQLREALERLGPRAAAGKVP